MRYLRAINRFNEAPAFCRGMHKQEVESTNRHVSFNEAPAFCRGMPEHLDGNTEHDERLQ